MTRVTLTSCTPFNSARASPPYWTLPPNTTVRAAQWLRTAASNATLVTKPASERSARALFLPSFADPGRQVFRTDWIDHRFPHNCIDLAHGILVQPPAEDSLHRPELIGPLCPPQRCGDAGAVQHPTYRQFQHSLAVAQARKSIEARNCVEILRESRGLKFRINAAYVALGKLGVLGKPSREQTAT